MDPTQSDIRQRNLDAALRLAAEGFAIFPAKTDKSPRIGDPFARATDDEKTIRDWWTEFPDAVPALPCGARNRIAVLDVDRKNGKDGFAALEAMDIDPAGLSPVRVDTPSGGAHFYFDWPQGLRNSTDRIAEGVDVRGEGGFVIAPGAVMPTGEYSTAVDLGGGVLGRPAWPDSLRWLISDRPKKEGVAAAQHAPSLDLLRRAVEALPNDAGHFDGRDDWVALAHAVRGSAIGTGFEEEARGLWLDFCARWSRPQKDGEPEKLWESCHTPTAGWHALLTTLGRANPSAAERLSAEVAELEFSKLTDGFSLEPIGSFHASEVPPRKRLYGKHLIAGHVSMLVAPGGSGKSALLITEALSMVTGREILPGEFPHHPLRVWYHNAEDDTDDMKRLLAAAMDHHSVDHSELGGRLFVTSGRDLPIKLASQGREGPTAHLEWFDFLIEHIRANGIEVLILDPLGALHSLPENANEAANVLMGGFRTICHETGAAIVLAHHAGKHAATDMESAGVAASRGASAFTDAARSVRQLARMAKKAAPKLCVPQEDCWRYIAVENGNPQAQEGWKAAVSDYLYRQATTASKAAVSDGFDTASLAATRRMFDDNRAALAEVFSPQEMQTLQQAQTRLEILSRRGTQANVGSATAENQSGGLQRVLSAFAEPLGTLTTVAKGALMGGSYERRMRLISEYFPDANAAAREILDRVRFDPVLAKHLMDFPTNEAQIYTWSKQLNKLLVLGGASRE